MILDHIYIIAEAGVNHNGCVKTARKMVDEAVKAGADAIKFQTFKAENFVTKSAGKAEYQVKDGSSSESQFEMIKRLELGAEEHKELQGYCLSKKIDFLSTPFDLDSMEFLNSLGVPLFKIPSGEITNLPYLRKIGSYGKKIILSTGMSDLSEINDTLQIILQAGCKPSEVTLLHCNTEYPTPMEDVNLSAMKTIKEAFADVNIGYSDHTLGIEISIAAAALGASVIEKHFTLNRSLPGPDHAASLEPAELSAMVKAIRNVELARGDGIKTPSPSEKKNIAVARKSIVAAKKIYRTDIITEDMITAKRPGNGISPMRWDDVIGKKADKDYNIDELLEISLLENDD